MKMFLAQSVWKGILVFMMKKIVTIMNAVLLSACAFGDKLVSTSNPPKGINPASMEQAESAIVTAESSGSPGTMVSAFNDWTIWPLSGNDEFRWIDDPSAPLKKLRFVRRGASRMGWSVSMDLGRQWNYKGKIRPAPGSDVSYIGVDPSLAVSRKDKKIVAVASLGMSTVAFDSLANGTDEIVDSLGHLWDSLCIALSFDGGVSFGAPKCKIHSGHVDRTALAFDGDGCLWAAADFANPYTTKIFKICDLKDISFSEANPPEDDLTVKIYPEDRSPKLVTDDFGNIWLGTSFFSNSDGTTVVRRFSTTSKKWDYGTSLPSTCKEGYDKVPGDFGIALVNGKIINSIHTDFDVGYGVSDPLDPLVPLPIVRGLLTILKENKKVFVQGVEVNQLGCQNHEGWKRSSAGEGQYFQPKISFSKKGLPTVGAGALDANWIASSLSTEDVIDNKQSQVAVVRFNFLPDKTMQKFNITKKASVACTRGKYWGDYMGIHQFFDPTINVWRAVYSYSDSSPIEDTDAACDAIFGKQIAIPLHVKATLL